MDFYKQRRFICEITGHSSLTFFEAMQSEMSESKGVDESFPDALKEPVLRRVQFSTISRIDSLVDFIYDEFKKDFYPGEAVTISLDNSDRHNGIVREKAKFGEIVGPDGRVQRKAVARYFVALTNRPNEEALVDEEHLYRDRKAFTKMMLRSFIKNSVTREPWTGAPWLVKDNPARAYKIDTTVPAHLRRNKGIEKKTTQKKSEGRDGSLVGFVTSSPRLPELKPAGKSHKSKQLQQQIAKHKQQQYLDYQHGLADSEGSPSVNGHSRSANASFSSVGDIKSSPKSAPPPPPPIKYPIEDLEVVPSRDGTHRPTLKFLSRQAKPNGTKKQSKSINEVRMESVGPLLETWETLSVYCEIFQLDSFTFDDYVEAIRCASLDIDCQLFVEIHCAILKVLVDEESKGGDVHISLPELPEEEESDEDESMEDTSAIPSPEPEPEPEVKPAGRRTRSSLAKSELAEQEKAAQKSPTPEESIPHRAAEMLETYGWIDRLRKRDFKNGGWEIIVVGLLDRLGRNPKHAKLCEEILTLLAPVDEEPTQETARVQYATLDVNIRAKILQILCLLTVETKAVRGYMEECNEQMTVIRKEKIEWQRTRKAALEELRVLNDERKILLPDNTPPSPVPELEANGDSKMSGVDEDEEEDPDEDEEPHNSRSLRRGLDRAVERKRKREQERDKKERAEAAAKLPKMSNHFKKILRDIDKKKEEIKECEEEVAVRDNDLREADCPRTRCLGKDRFWNRYWWFERNGMPYAGLPSSSTADAGYANGCLWVQGPDEVEREGFIDFPSAEEHEHYRRAYQMTVPERKKLEEGPTNVFNAFEWGFYDEPDSVDMLIGWLDVRGNRESKLRKDLQLQREKICLHMEKRKEYLRETEELSQPQHEPTPPPPPTAKEKKSKSETRTSTRTSKSHAEPTPAPAPVGAPHYRSLAWRNTTALSELGHLHSEQPRPRKATRKADPDGHHHHHHHPREARGGAGGGRSGRQGKGLGRQGGRYDF
ncbi:MAG: hypothetical protein M4579_006539 [Chaenotheca gracillima]|nr:MAG: hypothetical protein M4579_006539 [Chaenotheca gracillima]